MIRVRFAPSPTGYLHIGGVRTALYNWLFARKMGGKFILRIEDTDTTRSTEEAIEAIIKDMAWLGLNADVGPFRQTQRTDLYSKAINKLLEEGNAYYCYCSTEELKIRRQEAMKKGLSPAYDKRCRTLNKEEADKYKKDGRVPAIRIAAPKVGQTIVDDLIRGQISFDNQNIDDYIILRSDNTPTYNIAVVVDDASMQITHVIRGDDHLSNTPRQLILYKLLGFKPPIFAHLPMIMGPDKQRLSKRHGATAVGEFEKLGYLPEALVNYLALLGWSYDEKTTFFTIDELIEKFSIEKVSKNPAIWDNTKLQWINGSYIREKTLGELTKAALPYLVNAGLISKKMSGEELGWLSKVISLTQERIKLLSEIAPMIDFFFKDKVEFEEKAFNKFLKSDKAATILKVAIEKIAPLEDLTSATVEEALRQIPQDLELKPKEVFQTIRVAITGRIISPPLFESIELLGHDRAVERLYDALKSE